MQLQAPPLELLLLRQLLLLQIFEAKILIEILEAKILTLTHKNTHSASDEEGGEGRLEGCVGVVCVCV